MNLKEFKIAVYTSLSLFKSTGSLVPGWTLYLRTHLGQLK
jgi:hypothetical protein